jgi:hypothetical protein
MGKMTEKTENNWEALAEESRALLKKMEETLRTAVTKTVFGIYCYSCKEQMMPDGPPDIDLYPEKQGPESRIFVCPKCDCAVTLLVTNGDQNEKGN